MHFVIETDSAIASRIPGIYVEGPKKRIAIFLEYSETVIVYNLPRLVELITYHVTIIQKRQMNGKLTLKALIDGKQLGEKVVDGKNYDQVKLFLSQPSYTSLSGNADISNLKVTTEFEVPETKKVKGKLFLHVFKKILTNMFQRLRLLLIV